MIEFTTGNLIESDAEALVNTVNTVGVMGKGIALMFKDAFPENFKLYTVACKRKEVVVGRMFVTERRDWVGGPRWIINFPTKAHWRHPSKMEWVEEGLEDLTRVISELKITSIALPPLGSGNGGLNWHDVRPVVVDKMASLQNVRVIVYEPTAVYQNVAKADGVRALTPARALLAELVRRYSVLGFECTILEIQKLAYLLERQIISLNMSNPLKLQFVADRFGPYTQKLGHLLNGLDGSYLHCEKRVADAGPLDLIWFDDRYRDKVSAYLRAEAKSYLPALDAVTAEIEGFETPTGMELLATVDWLLTHGVSPSHGAVKAGLKGWLGGGQAADRKLRLFGDDLIDLALQRLVPKQENSDADRT